jgi:hypothetical protein
VRPATGGYRVAPRQRPNVGRCPGAQNRDLPTGSDPPPARVGPVQEPDGDHGANHPDPVPQSGSSAIHDSVSQMSGLLRFVRSATDWLRFRSVWQGRSAGESCAQPAEAAIRSAGLRPRFAFRPLRPSRRRRWRDGSRRPRSFKTRCDLGGPACGLLLPDLSWLLVTRFIASASGDRGRGSSPLELHRSRPRRS